MQLELNRDDIKNDYFDWIYEAVTGIRYGPDISYRRLLLYLFRTEFTWIHPRDENRAEDGKALRYRFIRECGYNMKYLDYLDGPCSVLEMVFALGLRCEETIMENPAKGNRTAQWFWMMLRNMGIGNMQDRFYDSELVSKRVDRFLKRQYSPDGKGGLFYIRGCEEDLTKVEIWYQLCWYLDAYTFL